MSDEIRPDPKAKLNIKNALDEALYAPVRKALQEQINKLIIKNTVAGKFTHKSFIYKNEIFNCDTAPLPKLMNRLLPQFKPEMEAYLLEVEELNKKELPYVFGFINQVLNSSNEFHDYLRLFPNVIHDHIRRLISTGPCSNKRLTDEEVEEIKSKNYHAIQLIKQRIISNMVS